jgi:GH25 family lysozyme M1 (1,4-beta-N-acetylmuramidase)
VAGGARLTASTSVSPIAGSAKGVDVSDYTAVTASTWTDLRQAGITFVGVKASEGDYFKDASYQPHMQAATAAGLYVLPYVFANPYRGDAARKIRGDGTGTAQAAYAWDNEIGAAKASPAYSSSSLMLPVVLDIESDPYAGSGSEPNADECYGLGRQAMVTWIRQFLTKMEALSHKAPIIYTAPEFWARCTGNYAGFGSTYPLWVAVYRASSPPPMPGWSSPTFWQYTSSGIVRGISGPADLDYLGPILQGSALGTAIRPIQLRTLNALNAQGAGNGQGARNGQAVTYSPESLPPGLSVSLSGMLTGAPTVAGTYRVTILAAGGVPAAISFTWDTPLVAPPTEAGTVGVPVSVQVRATNGKAGATGYPLPALTARGLPAGLTIGSTGLITGWPYLPGRYRVTVSATRGSRVTASAAIAWTVKAAADSGTRGTIRQHGGSDKCLDDPSSRTANGTAIDLATCTGRPSQTWTAVKDGTIRVLGRCLTASGTHLLLDGCGSSVTEQWHTGTDGSLVSVRYGTCLAGPARAVASGTRPALATCTNSSRAVAQHWSRPAGPVVSGAAARCLDAAGSVAKLVTCAKSTAQHWSLASSSEIVVQANGQCVTESGAAAGSAIAVMKCFNGASQHWSVVSAGHIPVEIRNVASGLCLTVPVHSSASGTALILDPCSTALSATWRVG